MATDLQQTLQRLASKAKILAERYNVLMNEKLQADNKIEELARTVEQQKRSIELLTQELEYMKIASTIVPDRKQIDKTRATISGLVREIDRCILELNE